MKLNRINLLVFLGFLLAKPAFAAIDRVWLTHQGNDPAKIVINWKTAQPADSTIHFGPTAEYGNTLNKDESVRLHHVEIPMPQKGEIHYCVQSGAERSSDAVIRAYPAGQLRLAVVADWLKRPPLTAIVKDDIHLLLTAGDNILCLWNDCGAGVKDCDKPYSALIGTYPELFRSTPFMPILGNHDREFRPRTSKPPPEPVYDIDATAFRAFFALPNEEWKWYFDFPEFDVRIIALDLNHTSDFGTTWQTCHSFKKDSEQFGWYGKLMASSPQAFVVTLYNEQNSRMRSLEDKAWHEMFKKGSLAITGFGYFAERAEVDGFNYYNTSLSGTGAKYADPKSRFFASEDNYVLLTLDKAEKRLTAEIKSLDGRVLDRQVYGPRNK